MMAWMSLKWNSFGKIKFWSWGHIFAALTIPISVMRIALGVSFGIADRFLPGCVFG
jgi:hypothetical protein